MKISSKPQSDTNYIIMNFDFKEKFEQLSEDEKEHIYYISKAIWTGHLMTLEFKSYESTGLFLIFQTFFTSFGNLNKLKEEIQKYDSQKNILINNTTYNQFLKYASEFYSHFGNYSTFNKQKFFPELNVESFTAILELSPKKDDIIFIWNIISPMVYDKDSSYIQLEEKNGKNRYYLGNIKLEEIEKVEQVLKQKNINTMNTRLIKFLKDKVVVLISSIEERQENLNDNIILLYGEFSHILQKVSNYLEEAINHSTNQQIKDRLSNFINEIKTGKISNKKDIYLKNKTENPASHAFYDITWSLSKFDPLGKRGIFNGWVTINDEEMVKKISQFEQKDFFHELLAEFPWGEEFNSFEETEMDKNIYNIQKYNPSYNGPLNIHLDRIITFINNSKSNFHQNDLEFTDKRAEEIVNNFKYIALDMLLTCKAIFYCYYGKFFKMLPSEEKVQKDETIINNKDEKADESSTKDKEIKQEEVKSEEVGGGQKNEEKLQTEEPKKEENKTEIKQEEEKNKTENKKNENEIADDKTKNDDKEKNSEIKKEEQKKEINQTEEDLGKVIEKKFNFDPETKNPLTGKKIECYYYLNETFEDRFTILAPIVDECLSQGTSLFLAFNKSIQRIFLANKVDYKNIIYTIWFMHLRKGLLALQTYNPKTKEWSNASYQATWIFLQYILKNQKEEEKLVILTYTPVEKTEEKQEKKDEKDETNKEKKDEINKDKKDESNKEKKDDNNKDKKDETNKEKNIGYEVTLSLDKDMIICYGLEMISKFINQFHIWKCIGDIKGASEFINQYTQVNEKDEKIIISNFPEKLYLFDNIMKGSDESYSVEHYPCELEGIIQSNIDRYGTEFNKDIYEQWVKYATSFIKL